MKKLYFCATNGITMINEQLPYATKEAEASCNKMFDILDELNLNLNMAISSNKKEIHRLVKEWGFEK